jgi:hypothetical protein
MAVAAFLPLLVQGVKAAAGYVGDKGKASAALTRDVAQSLGERAGWVVGAVFLVWSLPFLYLIFAPEAGAAMIASLSTMPEWYRQGFTEISYGAAGAAALFKLVKR